ncbi:MAG: 3-isopropylmalate dehydratase small subunit [Bacillota bacterium]|nr:3-isopropylmalate dehydratase small subunit [Bacillota bacterium]
MKEIISGNAYVFSQDNIDTDQIYPGRYLELTEPEDIVNHAMEGIDEDFVSRFKAGGIVVAGQNFGCGSSREHAVITLKELGVTGVIAESFARIFFRNAINLGVPIVECPGISSKVKEQDELEVNFIEGTIKNLTNGEVFQGNKIDPVAYEILSSGGIVEKIKNRKK